MNAYDAMKANEGTISKITRDEAMSAHEFNEIFAFLLLITFKLISFSQLKYYKDCSRRHVNFYQIP